MELNLTIAKPILLVSVMSIMYVLTYAFKICMVLVF